MSYAAIPDSDLDAESLGKSTVFTQMRDNIVALYEDTRASAYKASDESDTTATLQDDDDFTFAVGASEVWIVRIEALVTTTDAASDLKFKLVTPSGGGSGTVHVMAYNSGAPVAAYDAVDTQITIDYTAAETGDPLIIHAYVSTGGSSGNVTLQWARSGGAGTTSLLEGSFLTAFRTDSL
jgi:hypothetical protein